MKLALVVFVAACTPGTPGERCTPGASEPCACLGGGEGVQSCAPDGSKLLACACAPPIDARTNDASAACGPGIYPCGPYGYTEGATIANLALIAARDTNANGHIDAGDATALTALSDLVTTDTQVMVVVVCAQWCTECVQDQPTLNSLYASYSAGGHVAFYDVLMEATQPGAPADLTALARWGTQRNIAYPIGIDPTLTFAPYFPEAAFPQHMLIRTRDMQIAYRHTGIDATLSDHIDAVLANP